MNTETWKTISGFEAYEVSDQGRVRSWKNCRGVMQPTPHVLKNSIQDPGYAMVNLRKDGKTHKKWVHSLVLEAFVGPRPDGQVARHFPDDDRTNCRLENLQWGTYAENENDKKLLGTYPLGELHHCAKLSDAQVTDIRNRLKAGERAYKLAPEYGVSRSHISMMRHGKARKCNYEPA